MNYKTIEKMLANSDAWLFKAMIEAIIDHIDRAATELESLENAEVFDTIEDYRKHKTEVEEKDYEVTVLESLLAELKEAQEVLEYAEAFRW